MLIFIFNFKNLKGIFYGENFFEKRLHLCIFIGSFCLVSCATSLFCMVLLAMNRYKMDLIRFINLFFSFLRDLKVVPVFEFRYLNICHNSLYKKIFTRQHTIQLCIMAWTFGFLVDLPNFVGWGGHYFDKKSANCMWNR